MPTMKKEGEQESVYSITVCIYQNGGEYELRINEMQVAHSDSLSALRATAARILREREEYDDQRQ